MSNVVAPRTPPSRTGDGREPLAMVVGPTRPAPSVLARLRAPAPPIADPDFLSEFGDCLSRFRELVGCPDGDVVITPGTGTTGMESLVVTLLQPGQPVVVASTGMWGDRWRVICLRHSVPVHGPTAGAGHAPDLDLLERLLALGKQQAILTTHVDSSSGVRTDIRAVARLAARHGALCLVDGVAALGAEDVEQQAWRVDAYLAAPPKALAAPAGLAMFSLSHRAVLGLAQRSWTPTSYSLDLVPWLPVMRAFEGGEFDYFQTPSSNLIMALSEALRLALAEGRPARVARHRDLRDSLHAGLGELGLQLLVPEPTERSNGVTVCSLPTGVDGAGLLRAVADQGVVVQSGTHPTAGSRTFRIGHMGNVTEEDIARTVAAVRSALNR